MDFYSVFLKDCNIQSQTPRVEQQPTDRLTLGFVYTDQASWLVPYKELLPPKEARKLLNRACELFDSSPRRTVCILTDKIVSL